MTAVLARAEAGTAAIDISIPGPLRPGHPIQATVELRGGWRAETIHDLALAVDIYASSADSSSVRSTIVPIADTITVHAAEHRVVGTTIDVPPDIPPTRGDIEARAGIRPLPAGPTSIGTARRRRDPLQPGDSHPIATDGGAITPRWATAIEAEQPQPIDVRPGDRLSQVLDAVSALGFFLVEASPHPADQPAVSRGKPTDEPAVSRGEPPGEPSAVSRGHPADEPAVSRGEAADDPSVVSRSELAGETSAVPKGEPTDEPSAASGADTGARPSPSHTLRFEPRWGPYADLDELVLEPAPGDDRLEVRVALGEPEGETQSARRDPDRQDRLLVRDTDRQAVRSDLRQLLARLDRR